MVIAIYLLLKRGNPLEVEKFYLFIGFIKNKVIEEISPVDPEQRQYVLLMKCVEDGGDAGWKNPASESLFGGDSPRLFHQCPPIIIDLDPHFCCVKPLKIVTVVVIITVSLP